VDSDNVEIRYSFRPMTSSTQQHCVFIWRSLAKKSTASQQCAIYI